MRNIFVYGSLMFEDVWHRLTANRYRKVDAELEGYIRLKVKGEDYPGIIPSADNRVSGEVIFNVSADDIKQLDIFEGEYYYRETVEVLSGLTAYQAETYVFRKKYQPLLSNEEWQIEGFRNSGLSSFLARYDFFNQQ